MGSLRKQVELDFTTLIFFNDYVISTVKNDIVLEKDQVHKLKENCREFFGDKDFAFISVRKNNFNVNPIIYLNLEDTKVRGIAIVSEDFSRLQTANFEKQFSPVPFELFQNIDEARAWAHGLVK